MKDINEQLLVTIPETSWLPVTLETGSQAKWLPLFAIPNSDVTIGLTQSGVWLATADNSAWEFTVALAVPLLLLLEKPLSEVTVLITTGVTNCGLPEEVVQVVVFATMFTGLSGASDYWQNLAMNWLAEIENPDDDILAALEKVVTDGRTQQVRHKARRILKSFYKSDI